MNKFQIIITIISLLLVSSCAQKYDNIGSNPSNPDEIPTCDTVTVSTKSLISSFNIPSEIISNKYFIGTEVNDNDTLKSAFSFFNLKITEEDTIYDKLLLLLPLDPSLHPDSNDFHYEIGTLNNDFDKDSNKVFLKEILSNSSLLKTDTLVSIADSLDGLSGPYADFKYYIRLEINNDSIRSWSNSENSTKGFYLNGNNTDKLYEVSNNLDNINIIPLLRKCNIDTAHDGSDSLVIATADTDPIADFLTVLDLKPETLDDEELIRIGGINGERYVCKFNFTDTGLDSTTTLLTVRFVLEYAGKNDLYNDISKIQLIPLDTTWNTEFPELIINEKLYSDNFIAEFTNLTFKDGSSVTPNIGDLIYLSSINYLFKNNSTSTTAFPGWLNKPDKNFGFVLQCKDAEKYLGYSDFIHPRFEITYIKKPAIFDNNEK